MEEERLGPVLDDYWKSGGQHDDPTDLAARLNTANLLTKWQAEKLRQGKYRGFFLGKYRILSLLGKGGMSAVYLAEHRVMRRLCALKVLPAKKVNDSSYLERFHREAQAVAQLDHQNIVRAYDVDLQTDGGHQIHFLVMEYVEGQSVLDLVDEEGLPSFLDAADYIRQAAEGLQHAHDRGMVHRDIKPGNLLVDAQGVVKILDLGLARFFKIDEGESSVSKRHDEKVLGTADYLSPEQALDSHAVDARSDIYSLGCTLYFMLTGRPPFTDGTLAQRLLAHQVKEPRPVESIRTDTPASLATILRKMMEKKPENRFGSATEVANVLFRWVNEFADDAWRSDHATNYGLLASESGVIRAVSPIAKPVVIRSGIEISDNPRKPPIAPPTSSISDSHFELPADVPGSTDTMIRKSISTFTRPNQKSDDKSGPIPDNSSVISAEYQIPKNLLETLKPMPAEPRKGDLPLANGRRGTRVGSNANSHDDQLNRNVPAIVIKISIGIMILAILVLLLLGAGWL